MRRARTWIALAVALAALAIAVLPATAAVSATTVTVKASEFKFVLSRKSVPRGVVTFKIKNVGKIPHDFKIKGRKTPLISPGKSATLRVTFTKKGRYVYICTIPGHAQAGMKGFLTVK